MLGHSSRQAWTFLSSSCHSRRATSCFEEYRRPEGAARFYRRWHNAGSSTSEKPTLRFFIEPVVLAAAYAQSSAPNYGHVALVGLSGGGWTIATAASLLPNVKLTVAVAGLCRDPALATAYLRGVCAAGAVADQARALTRPSSFCEKGSRPTPLLVLSERGAWSPVRPGKPTRLVSRWIFRNLDALVE